jgi:hypothetical protein
MSGMMAAHVIAQVASGSASDVAAIEAYSAWLREWFQADTRELWRMYRELPHPPPWVRERPASLAEQIQHDRPLPADRA